MTTIQQLVDYVMINRRGKAFEGWSPIEIAEAFIMAVEDMSLVYCVDSTGKVNGVAHFGKFHHNILHVYNVVTTQKGVLQQFVAWFKNMYPTYKLEAERHGKRVVYDTPRLVRKLSPKGAM